MKTVYPTLLLPVIFLLLPSQSNAILLDCEVRESGIYQCIEISDADSESASADAAESYGEAYQQFREQARSQCTYKEPRKRTSGKNTSGALRTEDLKAARKDYEECVNSKARALWQQQKKQGD